MRLRIELDGRDPTKTKFIDAISGEPIQGIAYAEITIEPFNVGAYLFFNDFELSANNIEGEVLDPNKFVK